MWEFKNFSKNQTVQKQKIITPMNKIYYFIFQQKVFTLQIKPFKHQIQPSENNVKTVVNEIFHTVTTASIILSN